MAEIFDGIRNLLREGRSLAAAKDYYMANIRYPEAAASAMQFAMLRDRGRLSLLPEEL